MREAMTSEAVRRRAGGGLRAAGWVGRRLVTAAIVVGLVLFEVLLWSLTNLRISPDDLCVEQCPRGRPPGPAPDLQPHVALFWLINGLLLAVLFLVAVLVRIRRKRGLALTLVRSRR